LKIAIEQPEKVGNIVRKALEYMEKNYSLKAVAPTYKKAIKEIMHL
jgi:hypothetical protein